MLTADCNKKFVCGNYFGCKGQPVASSSDSPGLLSVITSKLSERPLKSADQKTERGKVLKPEYNIDRDQPTSRASPLRINVLLSRVLQHQLRAVNFRLFK